MVDNEDGIVDVKGEKVHMICFPISHKNAQADFDLMPR